MAARARDADAERGLVHEKRAKVTQIAVSFSSSFSFGISQ
jgi:hypothetical protein